MTLRTTKKTVSFKRPFVLDRWDEVLPPGDYCVETDEELLDSISFPAYWRTLTLIHLPPTRENPGRTRTATIDPKDLDEVLKRDAAPAETRAGNLQRGKADLRADKPNDNDEIVHHPHHIDSTATRKPFAIFQIIKELVARVR